jgi:hypothetical protein
MSIGLLIPTIPIGLLLNAVVRDVADKGMQNASENERRKPGAIEITYWRYPKEH